MTARPQDVALLPLPDSYMASEFVHNTAVYGANQMHAYARANVTAALASAQAREEELRAEVRKLTVKCRILERARDRYMPCPDCRDKIEPGCCERCKRQRAESRAERLEEALRLIESAKRRGFGIDYARGVALGALPEFNTTNAAQPGETM